MLFPIMSFKYFNAIIFQINNTQFRNEVLPFYLGRDLTLARNVLGLDASTQKLDLDLKRYISALYLCNRPRKYLNKSHRGMDYHGLPQRRILPPSVFETFRLLLWEQVYQDSFNPPRLKKSEVSINSIQDPHRQGAYAVDTDLLTTRELSLLHTDTNNTIQFLSFI